MRKTFVAAIAMLLAAAVPVRADEGHMMEGMDHEMATAQSNAAPLVAGEVKKVDESAAKVTIKHDAIPNLDMGAMTMVFKAGDGVALKDVKPGDKIKFSADKVNGQITVTHIEKSK